MFSKKRLGLAAAAVAASGGLLLPGASLGSMAAFAATAVVTPTPAATPTANPSSTASPLPTQAATINLGEGAQSTLALGAASPTDSLAFITATGEPSATITTPYGTYTVQGDKVLFTAQGKAGTDVVTYSLGTTRYKLALSLEGTLPEGNATVSPTATPSVTPPPSDPGSSTPSASGTPSAPATSSTPSVTPSVKPSTSATQDKAPAAPSSSSPSKSTPPAPVAPKTVDDKATVVARGTATVSVLANDKGALDASSLVLIWDGTPVKTATTTLGTFTVRGGKVVFASSGAEGDAVMNYRVNDTAGTAVIGQLIIVVKPNKVVTPAPSQPSNKGGTTGTPPATTTPKTKSALGTPSPSTASTRKSTLGKTPASSTVKAPTRGKSAASTTALLGGRTKLADQHSGASTGITITTATGTKETLTTDDAGAVDNSANTAAGEFTSCTQAVAAGHGSTPRGSAHYQANLDGDSDGVMCETRISSGATRETTSGTMVLSGSLLVASGLMGAGALAMGGRKRKVTPLRVR